MCEYESIWGLSFPICKMGLRIVATSDNWSAAATGRSPLVSFHTCQRLSVSWLVRGTVPRVEAPRNTLNQWGMGTGANSPASWSTVGPSCGVFYIISHKMPSKVEPRLPTLVTVPLIHSLYTFLPSSPHFPTPHSASWGRLPNKGGHPIFPCKLCSQSTSPGRCSVLSWNFLLENNRFLGLMEERMG